MYTDDQKETFTGLGYYSILGPNNYLWIPAFEFAVSKFKGNIKGWNVLEIGAGIIGGLSSYFAKRGCKVICSDINKKSLLSQR